MSLIAASRGEWNRFLDPTAPGPQSDSRCTIRLTPDGWEHIRSRHLDAPEEPWGEWLGGDALDVLRRPLPDLGEPPAEVDEAVERLRAEICHALDRPLVVLYEGIVERGPNRPTWLLVLPCGARLVVRRRPNRGNEVMTCYFPRPACAEGDPARRWRANARQLLFRFAVMDFSVNGFVPPPDDLEFAGGQWPETGRVGVRFVSLVSWGFRPELRGSPWRGQFLDWPNGLVPEKPVRLHRLKKRRAARRAGLDIEEG